MRWEGTLSNVLVEMGQQCPYPPEEPGLLQLAAHSPWPCRWGSLSTLKAYIVSPWPDLWMALALSPSALHFSLEHFFIFFPLLLCLATAV